MKFTETVIEQYTQGDCWVLALEMARISGWRVALTKYVDHAFVISPDCKSFLDIRGLQNIKKLQKDWGSSFEQVFDSLERAEEYFRKNDWGTYYDAPKLRQARYLANQLVSQYVGNEVSMSNAS